MSSVDRFYSRAFLEDLRSHAIPTMQAVIDSHLRLIELYEAAERELDDVRLDRDQLRSKFDERREDHNPPTKFRDLRRLISGDRSVVAYEARCPVHGAFNPYGDETARLDDDDVYVEHEYDGSTSNKCGRMGLVVGFW